MNNLVHSVVQCLGWGGEQGEGFAPSLSWVTETAASSKGMVEHAWSLCTGVFIAPTPASQDHTAPHNMLVT